ncbi:MAG: radical SAM protein [Candidatus Omnitrophica bacterium]|nr:radical SAM protein [Candidatus Omnitrophota bacterium]MCA9424060.1 radical SAM protein [Candidatus Omnitrophota bacterium]MCA9435208.1 radical SAM protein [Candidatus Omnitrophota bacterium]MCA9441090.1 radical SAM protein [Candidatus Omnitrophota bacterium]MCA9446239.1 radical SAM protein [Candidatus Omnitrophota bacterium]
MKVFLGNGPWYRPGYYGVRAGSRWPHYETDCSPYMPFPFYLAYATALLEKDGHECLLIDGIAERTTEEDYVERATKFDPDLIILEVSTPSMDTDIRQTKAIKDKCPNARVVYCGLHLLDEDDDFLASHRFVDFTMRGEYDFIAQDLANALDTGGDLTAIKGLNFFDEATGKTHDGGRREVIKDLDSLPWPSRDQLPMYNYHDHPGGIPGPSLQMWASRGCPFRCIFCVWPQIMYEGNLYNTRNPVDVADEVEYTVKKWGFKSFYFDDDTFNIGKKRLLRLSEEIAKRDLGVPWAAMCRADTTDKETLREMKKSGLAAVKYGVESASQELVDAADKSLDLAKVEEMVRYTQEIGINVHLTFSFGLPGETHETAMKTINWSQELNPDSIQYSIMTPFPGSRFYKELEEKGHLLTKDWSKFDGNSMSVVRTEALSGEDLEEYIRKAYKSWEWHKLRRALFQPKYMKRSWKHPLQGFRNFRYGLKAAARA